MANPPVPLFGDIGPDAPPVAVTEPRDFFVTISADGKTLYLNFVEAADDDLARIVNMRIYYIDGTKVARDQIATISGYELARRYSSTFVTQVTMGHAASKVALEQSLFPNGGWFWGLAINPGAPTDAIDPSTSAVPIPEKNNQIAAPSYQVTNPLVTINSVTIDGAFYKELFFSWRNPNPTPTSLGQPIRYILIVMNNYRYFNQYEKLVRFNCSPDYGVPAATSAPGVNGYNHMIGPVYLQTDWDGAHNVIFYFVVENASRQHLAWYITTISASYTVVGGI